MSPSVWRRELLEGLLGADLIGFHTHDYTTHFVTCVRRMLASTPILAPSPYTIGWYVPSTFPMGIDFEHFQELALVASGTRGAEASCGLAGRIQDHRVGGLPRWIRKASPTAHGYLRFWRSIRNWHGKVCLGHGGGAVLHWRRALPGHEREIDELVGASTAASAPSTGRPFDTSIECSHRSRSPRSDATSDIGLVTPLRDGINLVAKEYVAVHSDGRGVLILSEMAGAARELGEALIVNPNFADEIADAIDQALEMPVEQQMVRTRAMQDRIRKFDVVWWADDFCAPSPRSSTSRRAFAHVALCRRRSRCVAQGQPPPGAVGLRRNAGPVVCASRSGGTR